MSNYPPGVSGNEWQITGPQSETDEQREVEHECDEDTYSTPFKGTVLTTVTYWDRYSPLSLDWTCPQCGEVVETEEDPGDGYDE